MQVDALSDRFWEQTFRQTVMCICMWLWVVNLWWRLSPHDGTNKVYVPVVRYVYAVYPSIFLDTTSPHLLVNGLLKFSCHMAGAA